MIGIIPAAGFGSRLVHLSKNTPKAMLEIRGIPLLRIAIESLKEHVDRIVVIVGHHSSQITDYIRNNDFGIAIDIVQQKEINGVPKALVCAEKFIDGRFVIYFPDNLLTHSQNASFREHMRKKPLCTFICQKKESDWSDRANLVVKNGRIVGISEDGQSSSLMAAIGLSIHEKEFLDYCKRVPINVKKNEYLLKDVIQLMLAENKIVAATELAGRRIDITTSDDYDQLIDGITKGKIALHPAHLFE